MILDIIIFIIILAVLVISHELGHFLAAKKFGMFVEEFGFGFPPRIKSYKKEETVWSINAIPLGGFVKIAGEDGVDSQLVNSSEPILSSRQTIEVINSNDKEIIIDQKETEIKIDQKIPKERFFSSKPIWQRAVVLIAGVLMNFILGWLMLILVFSIGTKPVVIVSQVADDSPAKLAGIKVGDKIAGFLSPEEVIRYVNEHKGQTVSLNLIRNGKTEVVNVVPRPDPPAGQGPLGVGLIGGGVERQPFFSAVIDATKAAFGIFAMIYVLLFKLIASVFGGANVFQYLSGPIGIFQATSQASSLGWVYLANLVALISLNLAALNIFPFPALDGGRILFLIIEKIKGSPVSLKVQQIVNGVGFAFLLVLLIAASVQDVIRILH
jgi:regulator of sigma E protease